VDAKLEKKKNRENIQAVSDRQSNILSSSYIFIIYTSMAQRLNIPALALLGAQNNWNQSLKLEA